MFDESYNKIISQQIFSSIDQKYKKYIIAYLDNQNTFKYYLNLGYDKSDIDMYNMLKQTYYTDKYTAIVSMLTWKTYTLSNSYYIILDLFNQKQYYDGTLNIKFIVYNLKTAKIEQLIYQVYGRNKAIFYSMIKSKKSLNYIYNYMKKYGMHLL